MNEDVSRAGVQARDEVRDLILCTGAGSAEELVAKYPNNSAVAVVPSEALLAQVASVVTQGVQRSGALGALHGGRVVIDGHPEVAAQHDRPYWLSDTGGSRGVSREEVSCRGGKVGVTPYSASARFVRVVSVVGEAGPAVVVPKEFCR